MNIQSSAGTDVGRVREANEDAYFVSNEMGLFVVADGMGGHVGGQIASKLAVETISQKIESDLDAVQKASAADDYATSSVHKLLAASVREACRAIYEKGQLDPELQGMGTTVTALYCHFDRAFVAHVGDSRCYLRRGDVVIQITDDHSLVNEQLKMKLITPEEARNSRHKNVITRSVGFEKDVAVDTLALPIEDGDRFLICSDGLANFVDMTEIGLALATLDVDEVPQRMINLANERGGDDNITVVCLAVQTNENSADESMTKEASL